MKINKMKYLGRRIVAMAVSSLIAVNLWIDLDVSAFFAVLGTGPAVLFAVAVVTEIIKRIGIAKDLKDGLNFDRLLDSLEGRSINHSLNQGINEVLKINADAEEMDMMAKIAINPLFHGVSASRMQMQCSQHTQRINYVSNETRTKVAKAINLNPSVELSNTLMIAFSEPDMLKFPKHINDPELDLILIGDDSVERCVNLLLLMPKTICVHSLTVVNLDLYYEPNSYLEAKQCKLVDSEINKQPDYRLIAGSM